MPGTSFSLTQISVDHFQRPPSNLDYARPPLQFDETVFPNRRWDEVQGRGTGSPERLSYGNLKISEIL